MPEGPEIRHAADRIASAIEGEVADEVYFAFDTLKPWQAVLRGKRVRRVESRGKAREARGHRAAPLRLYIMSAMSRVRAMGRAAGPPVVPGTHAGADPAFTPRRPRLTADAP